MWVFYMKKQILKDSVITVSLLAFALFLAFVLNFYDNSQLSIACSLILAVLFTARFTHGYVYGIISSFAGTLLINYFFTFPYFEFNLTMPINIVTAIATFTVSIVTSAVTTQLQNHRELAHKAELEMMRTNLMRSVSHDLRTPLTSIMGAATVLKENDSLLDAKGKAELYDQINDEARWLFNMVENLLSVTRLNNSIEPVHKDCELAEEIIAVAVKKIQKYYKDINIIIDASDNMIFVPMDFTLISQVLINLIENSIRHGNSSHYIRVSVRETGNYAEFFVEDRGGGLPKSIISALNSNEYIMPESTGDSSKYMGIGLSVCEAIIKSHGGYIHAQNLECGAKVAFFLPLDEYEDM